MKFSSVFVSVVRIEQNESCFFLCSQIGEAEHIDVKRDIWSYTRYGSGVRMTVTRLVPVLLAWQTEESIEGENQQALLYFMTFPHLCFSNAAGKARD